ncbi:hypothetical protein [Streptomyces sp. NPDC059949]|uniref:hypothetical protein n=1 Tax=Streptomyces sp. NPDC059949 TaxID=3347013 RepID=UPI003647E336
MPTVPTPHDHNLPAEAAGCRTWQLTPDSHGRIDHEIDQLGVFAKGYWQDVDGKLAVVGLRIGQRPDHVIAFYGDRIIRHPDGRFTVQPAPHPAP